MGEASLRWELKIRPQELSLKALDLYNKKKEMRLDLTTNESK